jgi:hypothetical protein
LVRFRKDWGDVARFEEVWSVRANFVVDFSTEKERLEALPSSLLESYQ